MPLLSLEATTIFVLTGSARILRRNSPDGKAGPRFHLKGCAAGNVLHLGHSVSEPTAQAIERLATDEPPLSDPDHPAVHFDQYVELLGAERPVERCDEGLLWCFPSSLQYEHRATLVCSDTPDGDRLVERFTESGIPEALFSAGFVDIGEFWWPWCFALESQEVASIAFAAGLGPSGAEVGVYTVPPFGVAASQQRRLRVGPTSQLFAAEPSSTVRRRTTPHRGASPSGLACASSARTYLSRRSTRKHEEFAEWDVSS